MSYFTVYGLPAGVQVFEACDIGDKLLWQVDHPFGRVIIAYVVGLSLGLNGAAPLGLIVQCKAFGLQLGDSAKAFSG